MNDHEKKVNNLLNDDKVHRVLVTGLSIGMKVVELDKPWAESSFLFQGFTIESESDIEELKKECSCIYIVREVDKKSSMIRGADEPTTTIWSGQTGGRAL